MQYSGTDVSDGVDRDSKSLYLLLSEVYKKDSIW